MATYSGLWDGEFGVAHSLLVGEAGQRKKISKLLRKPGSAVMKELMLTVNGVGAGSTALATRTQVTAKQDLGVNPQGGVVTVASKDLINRATVAADITDLATVYNEQFRPGTFVEDSSGNGGGGKVGV